LKARSWLFEQKSAIETEIARLKRLAAIEAAERLAKTNALSQKKNDLARDELANGYRDRFFAELEALGGKRIPVAPVAIPERKGKVSFQLSLNGTKLNVPTPEVLSEGENRIVALSAFIADMLGSAHLAPFVFDDPISSLDQEFEERVVDRLVALSKTRQVIVFTHRLSLMALLEEAVKKVNQFAVAHGGAIDEPVIISLRRFGNVVGITEDVIARNMKPNSGFNVLNMQSIPRIKKYLEGNQIPEYEYAIKAACSDFRILIERCIEQTLLCDVVGRFRRAVNSQKIRLLPKMKPDDCAFLDDLMTRYSRYEHSQSLELSGELPKLEELIQDITNAQAWQQEYEKRIVA
jgi:energy-coupling factor transporter ATP-binding protein EcfA2